MMQKIQLAHIKIPNKKTNITQKGIKTPEKKRKEKKKVPGTGGSLEFPFFWVERNLCMKKEKKINKDRPPRATEVAKCVAWNS